MRLDLCGCSAQKRTVFPDTKGNWVYKAHDN
jgi:hypothetical protein